jgi:hypothetical protein
VDHLDKTALRCHHGINVLIGHRNFVDYAFVFTTLDVRRCVNLVFDGKTPPGLGVEWGDWLTPHEA